jgi:hypothetical protein
MQLTTAINVLFSTNFVSFFTKELGIFLIFLGVQIHQIFNIYNNVGWGGREKHPNGNNP